MVLVHCWLQMLLITSQLLPQRRALTDPAGEHHQANRIDPPARRDYYVREPIW
jgi:hypothetical protein